MQRLRLLLAPHQPGCAPPGLQHLNPLRGPAGGALAWEWVTWGGASRRGLSKDLALSQGSWSPETPTFWPQHPWDNGLKRTGGRRGTSVAHRTDPPILGQPCPGGRQEGVLASTSRSGAELRKSLGACRGMRGGKTPGAVCPQEGARGLWSCLSTRWPRPL